MPEAAKLSIVPSNRDEIVSNYVRKRIREWRDSGRELQDLARVAGFAKSTPSQVMSGTGVGAKTGPGFAIAFEFPSFDAMRDAAWVWHQERSSSVAERPQAAVAAVEMVLSLNQGTKEQVDTIVDAYQHPRFRARDYDWWLGMLLEELKLDRLLMKADKAERIEASVGQRTLREANRQRRAPIAGKAPRKHRRAG